MANNRGHMRKGVFNFDTLRARIIVLGSLAASITAILYLSNQALVFGRSKADNYIDERIEKKNACIYKMVAKTWYVQSESVDSTVLKRAMNRMRMDSIRDAQRYSILGR